MKERFDHQQWDTLRALPFEIFGMVAVVDGKIDEREVQELTDRLQRGARGYKDPLHRELAMDIMTAGPEGLASSIKAAADPNRVIAKEARVFLEDKLSKDEYQSFVGSLIIDAIAFGKASLPGRFRARRRKNVAERETTVIAGFANIFGVDAAQLMRNYG